MQNDKQLVRFDSPEGNEWLTHIKNLGTEGVRNLITESVPFGNLCVDTFRYASNQVQQKQVEQFFKLIAQHSKSDDEAQLLVDLAKGLDTPQVYHAIINGYQAMHTCADEMMKGPLAVLVSSLQCRASLH